jgi:hypothetical protein
MPKHMNDTTRPERERVSRPVKSFSTGISVHGCWLTPATADTLVDFTAMV